MLPFPSKSKNAKSDSKKLKVIPKEPRKAKASETIPNGLSLSAERIIDSDSDASPSARRPESTGKGKKTRNAHKSLYDPQTSAALPSFPSSDESDSSQSESSEDQKDSNQALLRKSSAAPVGVNGVKRKAKEADSEEQTSSDDKGAEHQPTKKAKNSRLRERDTASSLDKYNGKQAGDGSAFRFDAADPRVLPSVVPASRGLQNHPANPYSPPVGFAPLNVSACPWQTPFSPKKMSNKQIWIISAPAGVPLQAVEEVALEAVQDGSTVLEHKGVGYMLAEDTDRDIEFQSVFLPSPTGYQLVDWKVERALRLLPKVTLPNLSKLQADTGSGRSVAGDGVRAEKGSLRLQPKGLKMRYKPPAFGLGDPGLGSESEEREQIAAEARRYSKSLSGRIGSNDPDDKRDQSSTKRKKEKKPKTKDTEAMDLRMLPLPSSTLLKPIKDENEKALGRDGIQPFKRTIGSQQGEAKEKRRKRKKLEKHAKEKTQDR